MTNTVYDVRGTTQELQIRVARTTAAPAATLSIMYSVMARNVHLRFQTIELLDGTWNAQLQYDAAGVWKTDNTKCVPEAQLLISISKIASTDMFGHDSKSTRSITFSVCKKIGLIDTLIDCRIALRANKVPVVN